MLPKRHWLSQFQEIAQQLAHVNELLLQRPIQGSRQHATRRDGEMLAAVERLRWLGSEPRVASAATGRLRQLADTPNSTYNCLMTEVIREFAPDAIVTHTDQDSFNPDHPVANLVSKRARLLASGAGRGGVTDANGPRGQATRPVAVWRAQL